MRRRIIASLGFGCPDPVLLDNKGKLNATFANEVLDIYFSDFGGFDYKVTKNFVSVGIEPGYQYEKLRILCIARDINLSFIHYGKAFGPYGSKILGKRKFYPEYKRDCKFKRIVEKYHPILFGTPSTPKKIRPKREK